MHAHDDQIGTLISGLTKNLSMGAALDDHRFHTAVGARLLRNQVVQTTAHLGDCGVANTRHIDFDGRRFRTDDRRRLNGMEQREMRVGFLGHVDGVREGPSEHSEKSTGQRIRRNRTAAAGATSGARGGTTSVGQRALRMTFSVTDPRKSR